MTSALDRKILREVFGGHFQGRDAKTPFPFTHDLRSVQFVLDKILSRGWHWWIASSKKGWTASIRRDETKLTFVSLTADSLPVAIGQAALKAVQEYPSKKS